MKYQNYFNCLEYSIQNNYTSRVVYINDSLFKPLFLVPNFCNERTIAYYSTQFGEEYIRNIIMKKCSVINEPLFTLTKSISISARNKYKKEAGANTKKTYNKFYIPDAAVSLKFDNIDKNYFVEYKVNNPHFKFFQLANDYLKYKLYSSSNTIDTKFIYIVFNKNDGIPTLLNGIDINPKIQFLSNCISKSTIDDKANVFIYDKDIIPMQNKNGLLEHYIGSNEINVIDKVIKSIEKLDEKTIDEFNNIKDYSNDVYVKNIMKLGNKVSTAKILLEKYYEIIKLNDEIKINAYELIDKANNFSEKKIETLDDLFYWMFTNFKNISGEEFKKEEREISSVLLNTIRRKSMFILLMLEKYSNDNRLNIIKIVPKTKKESLDLEKFKNSNFYQSLNSYKLSNTLFKVLCETIIYYLCGIYKSIYKIENNQILFDIDGNPLINENFSNYLIKKNIIENIRKIKYSFGKSNNFNVDWNIDLEDFGKSLLEIVAQNDFE